MEYVLALGSKAIAKLAWDSLKSMCIGSDCVRKARA
jgi:hypothetical protein